MWQVKIKCFVRFVTKSEWLRSKILDIYEIYFFRSAIWKKQTRSRQRMRSILKCLEVSSCMNVFACVTTSV
jgi:hypothetical protein